MLRVTQAELSRYRREVDAQAEKAREYFRAAIAEFYRRYPDATTEDTRVFVLDLMGSALPNFTDLTATLACDLFDELAEEVGFEGERARLYETTDWQMVDRKVHYLAEFLNEGDKERFKREVSDLTHYYCKRAAYDNMVANCRGQRVKWARVPTGLETCAFCFMLASRGFAYLSEKSAAEGHHGYHDNCDCVVVPGFEGPDGNPRVKIDGYDPEVMYRNWLSCAKTVGIDKHADPMDGVWTDDERRAVRREVATRDWHWLYTGEAPKVDYRRCPRSEFGGLRGKSASFDPDEYDEANVIDTGVNEWRDMFAHDALSWNGFRVTARESKALGPDGVVIDGVTTPDIEIDGVIWEIKSVRNGSHKPKNELSFIEQAIRDARKNFRNPYNPETKEGMGDKRSETRVVISTRYRSISARMEDIEGEFARRADRYKVSVIWIDSEGVVRRYGHK